MKVFIYFISIYLFIYLFILFLFIHLFIYLFIVKLFVQEKNVWILSKCWKWFVTLFPVNNPSSGDTYFM